MPNRLLPAVKIRFMHKRTVINHKGEEFQLTESEEKFLRALERLSKINPGRLKLMASGTLSVRINDYWHDDNIDGSHNVELICEGGDGGD